jgi:putative transposase
MNGRSGQHHRRSIRLRGYDYAQSGAYFVTICTQDRACLFGAVVDGAMRLNEAGRIIQEVWEGLPRFYPGIAIDAFVVMPNHIHGIIILVGAGPCACPAGPCACPAGPCACPGPTETGQPQGVAPTTLSLPDVVHRFKTMTTKRYIDGVKTRGWHPFPGRLWQRNYYEHIIRNEESLTRIRQYIVENPLRWHLDRENPDRNTPEHRTSATRAPR